MNGHTAVQAAPKQPWKCPECAIQPLLGLYALSGLHLRAAARHNRFQHYVVNLRAGGSVLAHCYACHAWRELWYDGAAQQIRERKWTGPVPDVGCDCEEGVMPNEPIPDPGAVVWPAEQQASRRVPLPEELPWVDPNSEAAACGICGGLYGQMFVDPFTGERRHVGCAPRQVVTGDDAPAPASPRPALAKPRGVARPEPPGAERRQEGVKGEPAP